MHVVPMHHFESGNYLNGGMPHNAPAPSTGGCSCPGNGSNGNGTPTGLPGVLGNSNAVILRAIAFGIGMLVKK